MRSIVATALIGLALAGPAWADTILHLSDTETVLAQPDELVASLRVVATATSAAAAQQQVNAAMAAALTQARGVAGVTVSTETYSAWQQPEAGRWQASQTLTLRSKDGAAVLGLSGELQAHGLAINELAWQLSPAASRAAHDAALRQAIGRLRARAEEAAGLLSLRFDSFQKVSIGGTAPPPPRPLAFAMAAKAAAPPSAVAHEMPVSATAEADAVLVAK